MNEKMKYKNSSSIRREVLNMGTYGLSPQEICDEIIAAVENMEGDFDVRTLNRGFVLARLKQNRIVTTDRSMCSKCSKMYMIRNMSFRCPHCGHNN